MPPSCGPRAADARESRWPAFPTPFTYADYGSGATPLTDLEMRLQRLSAAIRRKPEWWSKVHDEEIVTKWRGEAEHFLRHDDHAWRYLVDELRWHSGQVAVSGIRLSPVDGVFECDTLIPHDLRADLLAGVAKLEVLLDNNCWSFPLGVVHRDGEISSSVCRGGEHCTHIRCTLGLSREGLASRLRWKGVGLGTPVTLLLRQRAESNLLSGRQGLGGVDRRWGAGGLTVTPTPTPTTTGGLIQNPNP